MLNYQKKFIPENPGVYIFKDKYNSIIYIGKAKNLKNRIYSYFRQNHDMSPKTQFLVKNIVNLEYIIVDNEIEALLLENKLIKKHKPKYNIDLKDSKTYAYIKITNDKIPKILFTRKVTKSGDYFGPYTSSIFRRELVDIIVKIFNIITPHTYLNRSSLNYEIGLSPAPEINKINKEKYFEKIEQAKSFLKGKNTRKILNRLKTEMLKAIEEQNYEIANEKKKQIETIKKINEKQKVDLIKNYDQDVIVLIFDKNKNNAFIELFNISKGVISSKKEFRFEYYEELFESFIKIYYSQNPVPKEIIVNEQFFEDKKLLEDYISKIKGSKIKITYPKKGEKLSLVKLAEKNAKIHFQNDVLIEIKKKLSLPTVPKVIECFDMSNLGFEHLVGAMTRWVDAKPDKNGYRKFEIKSFKGKNDDYQAIKEVIYRRYKAIKDNDVKLDSNISSQFPDLIIIDGGKGQLRVALESLNKLNLKIPIISLAKKEEEIFLPMKENSLKFEKNSPMMLLIRQIRDSVHKYVLSYNRKKRDMQLKKEFEQD